MSNLNLSLHSNSKRFSREGFQPIPSEYQYQSNMASNDATIDIPLEPVQSNGGGLRSQSNTSALRTENTKTSSEKKSRSLWYPRGRRPKPENRIKPSGKVGYDGEEDTVNIMGKVYKRIRDFSTVTRYFLYVLPLASIIAIPIIIDAVSPTRDNVGGVRLLWFFVSKPLRVIPIETPTDCSQQ
jgi:hypothetical protein